MRLYSNGFSLLLFPAADRFLTFLVILLSAFPKAVYKQQELAHNSCHSYHSRLRVLLAQPGIEILHLRVVLSTDNCWEIERSSDVYVALFGYVALWVNGAGLMGRHIKPGISGQLLAVGYQGKAAGLSQYRDNTFPG